MVSVAGRIAVISLRFPSGDQMTPLADPIVRVSEDILAATPYAAIHPEIPSMTFTRRIGKVWIALENNPAGPTRAADPAVVHGTLALLLVLHRPKPGFKRERSACVRVVLRCPGHSRGGVSVSIVISGRAVVGSAGQRAGRRMPNLRSVGRDPSRSQIAQVDCYVRARGDFIEPQVNNWIVRFDERVIRLTPIDVCSVLVVSQYLGGA